MKKTFLGTVLLFFFAAVLMQAQNIAVQGTVTSKETGEPMIGASVACLSAKVSTITDVEGHFTLNCPRGAKLRVSCLGYKTLETQAEPSVVVTLEEMGAALGEAVVVGYQTVRKADLTGSVAVLDMKEARSETTGNIMSSMTGKLPGVNVVADAAPGGTGSIRIRGMATVNSSNDPLYIVDGVPTDNINCINPSDIETMQVLKDAASASIYGSRAAGGVVIITTKHGKGERMTVNVNYSLSAQTVAKRYDMLNAEQWGQAYWQAAKNSNITPSHPLYGNGDSPVLQPYVAGNPNYPTTDTDWQDLVYQTGLTHNLSASIANSNNCVYLLAEFLAFAYELALWDIGLYVQFRFLCESQRTPFFCLLWQFLRKFSLSFHTGKRIAFPPRHLPHFWCKRRACLNSSTLVMYGCIFHGVCYRNFSASRF